MMYTIKATSQFRRDYKLAMKQHRDISLLDDVIKLLANGTKLPREYNDHPLQGNYRGHRECHILPDWLLIYKVDKAPFRRFTGGKSRESNAEMQAKTPKMRFRYFRNTL